MNEEQKKEVIDRALASPAGQEALSAQWFHQGISLPRISADALSEYEQHSRFSAYVEATFDYRDVFRLQKAIQKKFGLKIPDEYIVTMIASSRLIATEVLHNKRSDEKVIDLIRDYLSQDLMKQAHPADYDSDEYAEYFKAFDEAVKQRGWQQLSLVEWHLVRMS